MSDQQDTHEKGTSLLNARELREILGGAVGLSTLYRLAANGTLPAVRLGGAVRFRRATIERFLAQQEARAFVNQEAPPDCAPTRRG